MKTSDDCPFGAGEHGNGSCFNGINCTKTPQGISHICDHNLNCHFGCTKPKSSKTDKPDKKGKHRRPKY